MKKRLIALIVSMSIGMGTLFSSTTIASAITAEDIHYKVAYEATVNVIAYEAKDVWGISDLQSMINVTRKKIAKLKPQCQGIPVFSQLLDERQQEVFVLLKDYVDNFSSLDNIYLEEMCYSQFELNEMRAILSKIKEGCTTYPMDMEEKVEMYQKEKIDKAVELFEAFKLKPLINEALELDCIIYDLCSIDKEHPKKNFIDDLYAQFREMENELFKDESETEYIKETLKRIVSSKTLDVEFEKYFDVDTLKTVNDFREAFKKFVEEHDEKYLSQYISDMQKEIENMGE